MFDLITNGQINKCTKHIDTRFKHICDHKDIVGEHVTTEDWVANVITKGLGSEKFLFFHAKLGVKE